MGRRLRSHLPGVPFHVTARVQGRGPLFSGLERFIVARIAATPRRSDVKLLAYAVMPNHLHLLLLQGRQPLSRFMQPLLRTIALLVQRKARVEGHVFERRFRATPCLDPDYFRHAVAYIHLNGLRAGLCANVEQFEWCSHALYGEERDVAFGVDPAIEDVLRLFGERDAQSLVQCRRDYRAFLEWRCAMDAHLHRVSDGLDSAAPSPPCALGGDAHWTMTYAAAAMRHAPLRRSPPDLRDLARAIVDECAPGMDMERLRCGDRGKAVVLVRRRFVIRASAAGYPGGVIARFLSVSPSTISSIRAAAQDKGR